MDETQTRLGVAPLADIAERPEGPIAVAIFSACCGIFALGLASLINQALNPSQWVPIPGLTPPDQLQGGRKMILMWSNFAQMVGLFFIMFIVWIVVWVVLYESFARRRRVGRRWYIASAVLLVIGLLLAFPPFYQWVFPEPVSGPFRLNAPFTSAAEVAGARAGPAASLLGIDLTVREGPHARVWRES